MDIPTAENFVKGVAGKTRSAARSLSGVGDRPDKLDALIEALADLRLPHDLVESLDPALKDLGLSLVEEEHEGVYEEPFLYHRASTGKATHLALISLKSSVVDPSCSRFVGSSLELAFSPSRSPLRFVRLFVFSNVDELGTVFTKELAGKWETKGVRAGFFEKPAIKKLKDTNPGNRKELFNEWLHLKLTDLRENQEEARRIKNYLHLWAAEAPRAIGVKGYMEELIDDTNWPKEFKIERAQALTGKSQFDANRLVDYALAKERIPRNERYTVIGDLLRALAERTNGEGKFLKDVIAIYNLIEDYSP